ncbi:hypothetical protein SBOR_4710 [Sclerotinia borealis F-4128]|uniref:Uncharacterized protein n=1 Tax=Sclerotinia borealis (strain F-4128) TaxID=1432307 RepID=W9CG66_SCLBF|nr:hypothetical protein SBOR_4710 [Sclerotinia borealis F-4128]
MRSFLAFFGFSGKTANKHNAHKKGYQNGRAGIFRSGTIFEQASAMLKIKEEEVIRGQNDECMSREIPLGERSSYERTESRAERTIYRLEELLQEIPRLKELQNEVVEAQILARQKMREVGFKRTDVSWADARFMKELQRLQADGQLEAFGELSRLAAACQSARDGLGPLEHEGTEAQQKFEGHMWNLQKLEDTIFDNLEFEFEETDEESSVTSDSSSPHDILGISSPVVRNNHESRDQQNKDMQDNHWSRELTDGGIERQQDLSNSPLPVNTISKKGSNLIDMGMLDSQNGNQRQSNAPIRFEHSVVSSSSIPISMRAPLSTRDKSKEEEQDSILLGLASRETLEHQEPLYEPTLLLELEVVKHVDDEVQQFESVLDSDSGIPSLDRLDNDNLTTITTKRQSSTESFPKLLTQFGTRRDRINKWLLHTMLISRSEANLIGLQLQKETDSSPSPWAQLIVAYFEFD